MSALVSIVVMTASMLVLGWWVWSSLERQESKDDGFRRKLQEDDERAARERGLPPPGAPGESDAPDPTDNSNAAGASQEDDGQARTRSGPGGSSVRDD